MKPFSQISNIYIFIPFADDGALGISFWNCDSACSVYLKTSIIRDLQGLTCLATRYKLRSGEKDSTFSVKIHQQRLSRKDGWIVVTSFKHMALKSTVRFEHFRMSRLLHKNIVQLFRIERTFATGAVCLQRTLTPPDTWPCPI